MLHELARREHDDAPSAPDGEVPKIASDENARACRGNREEQCVVGVGQEDRPRRGRGNGEARLIERRQKIFDEGSRKARLRPPQDFLVLLSDRRVEGRLQLAGEDGIHDSTGRPGGGEEPGH